MTPVPVQSRGLRWRCIAAALAGTALAYGLTHHLPVVPSTLVSSLVLAGTASTGSRLGRPAAWWLLVGAVAGALVGTGTVLAATLQERDAAADMGQRALTLLVLAASGATAGRSLGGAQLLPSGRAPRDLLRTVSALTTGVFAAIVALTYVYGGLEVARTFSSRLSTSLTILVISVAAPGWLSHTLSRPARRLALRSRRSEPPALEGGGQGHDPTAGGPFGD